MRGSIGASDQPEGTIPVLPALAGIDRYMRERPTIQSSSTRARGDRSAQRMSPLLAAVSSTRARGARSDSDGRRSWPMPFHPRARGSIAAGVRASAAVDVPPAYAGISRSCWPQRPTRARSTRARGDLSERTIRDDRPEPFPPAPAGIDRHRSGWGRRVVMFHPRTRGSIDGLGRPRQTPTVLPADAGIDLASNLAPLATSRCHPRTRGSIGVRS